MHSGAARTSARSRRPAVIGIVAALATVVAVVAALASTGGADAPVLADPGAAVRWGLPLVTAAARMAATVTIGAFALAAYGLTGPGAGSRVTSPSRAWTRLLRIGTVAALVWPLAQLAATVLGYASTWGRSPTEATFGDELWFYLTHTELGTTSAWQSILAVVVSLLAVTTAGLTGAAWTAVAGMAALVPVALAGHAAGAASHNVAVSSMWLHLVPVALWVGGLLALVAIAGVLGDELPRAAARFSAVAAWCFALVAVSGVFAAAIRLTSPADLVTTPWGRLLTLKVVAFAALGWTGWRHRRRTIPTIGERPGAFAALAAGEGVVMAAVMGIAVALAASQPPQPQDPAIDPSAVFALTGYPEPPLPTALTWLTQWHVDPLYAIGSAAAVVVYLAWVVRLRRRGDAWPTWRAICWVVAWALFFWVTCGGPAVYGLVLFSAHMVMHMALVMLAPLLMALAAPVTLLLRAVRPRRDGSRGPREWILHLVHSRWAAAWANPWVAGINFAGSLFVFYYTGLLPLALATHVGHVAMVVHFSLAGYLFANAIVGIDPGPHRPIYPVRIVLLFATMVFHAFFGLSLATMESLLAAQYYGRLGLTWWVDALTDQQIGGFVTWGIGELPTLVLAVVMAVQWSRADEKDARRIDRAADRDHDAELTAYNARLAARAKAMAERSR